MCRHCRWAQRATRLMFLTAHHSDFVLIYTTTAHPRRKDVALREGSVRVDGHDDMFLRHCLADQDLRIGIPREFARCTPQCIHVLSHSTTCRRRVLLPENALGVPNTAHQGPLRRKCHPTAKQRSCTRRLRPLASPPLSDSCAGLAP